MAPGIKTVIRGCLGSVMPEGIRLIFPQSVKIAVSVSSSRSVPFFQGEGCHWFAVRGQGNTHDTAGFCHKAHPSDAVLLSHGMENVSNLDCHVESVLFHYRKMFSAAPSVAAGSRISKGLQESGRAALGAGERASNTILWFCQSGIPVHSS